LGDVIDLKRKVVIAGPTYDKAEMVKEFGAKFGAPTDLDTCLTLIHEEVAEVAEAAEHLIKELMDLEYVIIWGTQCGLDMIDETTVNNIEHLEKWRTALSENVQLEAFRRVHESNMSKLWDDGKPHYRADGKVLKGPNYKLPEMSDLV